MVRWWVRLGVELVSAYPSQSRSPSISSATTTIHHFKLGPGSTNLIFLALFLHQHVLLWIIFPGLFFSTSLKQTHRALNRRTWTWMVMALWASQRCRFYCKAWHQSCRKDSNNSSFAQLMWCLVIGGACFLGLESHHPKEFFLGTYAF